MEQFALFARPAMSRLCAACARTWAAPWVPHRAKMMGLQNSNRIPRRFKGYIAPAGSQAKPLDGFYAGMQP